MVILKHTNSNVDLSGFEKIRYRTKQSGFRQLCIVIKLANGDWLISNRYDDGAKDWRIKEFAINEIVWHNLGVGNIVEVGVAKKPDLSNVEEIIGFTDLMPRGKSAACSRIDWIEVYGKSVKR